MSRGVRVACLLAALVLAGGLGACTRERTEDERRYPIQTDADAYVAVCEGKRDNYGTCVFEVVARYTNITADTVYLGRAFPNSPQPIHGVTMAAQEVHSAYDPVIQAVGHDQHFPVAPGQSRVDTLVVRGPNGWDGHSGKPFGALVGTMRLRYQPRTCDGDVYCALPDSLTASNVFEVHIRPFWF